MSYGYQRHQCAGRWQYHPDQQQCLWHGGGHGRLPSVSGNSLAVVMVDVGPSRIRFPFESNELLDKDGFSALCHVWTAPCWQGFFSMSHCWSELPCVRPVDAALFMAAGHNALRRSGPGQNHALMRRNGTNGLSRSVGRLAWVRYSIIALSNLGARGSSPACSLCCLMLVPAAVFGSSRCAPSSPRRYGRSCWPAQWRRP